MRVFANGICKPANPGGWACWAWIAMDTHEHVLAEQSGCAGDGDGISSGVAEYVAVLDALEWLRDEQVIGEILTDSRLVYNPVSGNWICGAKPLDYSCDRAITLLEKTQAHLSLIPREQNIRTHALSQIAYAAARRGQ